MNINNIRLYNFRNYSLQSIVFSSDLNIIYGSNAQGKTNILESLYIAANGCSHRTSDIVDCIKWEEQSSGVLIDFVKRNIHSVFRYQLSKNNGKKFALDEKILKMSELPGEISVVMFSPEDMQMIKGSPKQRRSFLDQQISQGSKIYARNLQKFNRVLQQRNMLLKGINYGRVQRDMLEEWNEQFALLAVAITKKRIEAIKRMSMLSNLVQRRLSGEQENINLLYKISGMSNDSIPEKEWYLSKLSENINADISSMVTSIGPQRDDFSVIINNKDCKHYGSQGQQRTCVLSLKMAEVEYIRSETGDYPVMLLDDVMSELDENRQKQIVQSLAGRVQTFITTTGKELKINKGSANYIEVKSGLVIQ